MENRNPLFIITVKPKIISKTFTENPIVIDLEHPKKPIAMVPYIIIPAPTGVFFESQISGQCCEHRKVEGFIIKTPSEFKVYDECEEGYCGMEDCGYTSPQDDELINGVKEARRSLALILNNLFKNINYNDYSFPVDYIRFNFDEVDELRESWWPVKIRWNGIVYTGYMTGWNCD